MTAESALDPMLKSPLAVGAIGLLLVVGLGALQRGRGLVRDTTLTAAWGWAVAAVVAVGGMELLHWLIGGEPATGTVSLTRYLAALLTLGPAMSVLGAKRPQHRGWQFIVFSLLVVLALPAAQAAMFRPGAALVLPPAWAVFLGVLLIVGVVNHLPSRFGVPSFLSGLGQFALFTPYQPWWDVPRPELWPAIGLVLIVTAAVLAVSMPCKPATSRLPLDRLWLDFRDLVGMAWGLRVAERFNGTARTQGWNVTLHWHGLADVSGGQPSLSPEVEQAAQRSLASLVGLFAAPTWIADRLGET